MQISLHTLILPLLIFLAHRDLDAFNEYLTYGPPKAFGTYISKTVQEGADAWVLRKDFSLTDVAPLLTLLAKIPFNGNDNDEHLLFMDILGLLEKWAENPGDGMQAKKLSHIGSCIAQIADAGSKELLTWCHKTYMREYEDKLAKNAENENGGSEKNETVCACKEWTDFFDSMKNNARVSTEDGSLETYISLLGKPCPLPWVRTAINLLVMWACEKKGMDRWEFIDKQLQKLPDGDAKEEAMVYWHLLLSIHARSGSIPLNSAIKLGAYVRCRDRQGSLFDLVSDEGTYNLIVSKGLTLLDEIFEEKTNPIACAVSQPRLANSIVKCITGKT